MPGAWQGAAFVYTSIVQDYIRAAMEMDATAFARQVEVPVLVWRAQGSGGLFAWGETRQSDGQAPRPGARELLRGGLQLPVLTLRQHNPGQPGEVRVGRAGGNDLTIADDTVSSRHAIFQRNDRTGSFNLRDLGSTNGSRVNGRALTANRSVVLFDADQIELGDAFLVFFYPPGFYQVLKGLVD